MGGCLSTHTKDDFELSTVSRHSFNAEVPQMAIQLYAKAPPPQAPVPRRSMTDLSLASESEFGSFKPPEPAKQTRQLRRRSITMDNIPVLSMLSKKDPAKKIKQITSANNYPGIEQQAVKRSFRRRGSLDSAWIRTGHAPIDVQNTLVEAEGEKMDKLWGPDANVSVSINNVGRVSADSTSVADMFRSMADIDNHEKFNRMAELSQGKSATFDKTSQLEALREQRRRSSMDDLRAFHKGFASPFVDSAIMKDDSFLSKPKSNNLLSQKSNIPAPTKAVQYDLNTPGLAEKKTPQRVSLELIDVGDLMDGLEEAPVSRIKAAESNHRGSGNSPLPESARSSNLTSSSSSLSNKSSNAGSNHGLNADTSLASTPPASRLNSKPARKAAAEATRRAPLRKENALEGFFDLDADNGDDEDEAEEVEVAANGRNFGRYSRGNSGSTEGENDVGNGSRSVGSRRRTAEENGESVDLEMVARIHKDGRETEPRFVKSNSHESQGTKLKSKAYKLTESPEKEEAVGLTAGETIKKLNQLLGTKQVHLFESELKDSSAGDEKKGNKTGNGNDRRRKSLEVWVKAVEKARQEFDGEKAKQGPK